MDPKIDRRERRGHVARLWLFLLPIFILSLHCVSSFAQEQPDGAKLSIQELLDYHLQSLEARMQKTRENNQQILLENQVLAEKWQRLQSDQQERRNRREGLKNSSDKLDRSLKLLAKDAASSVDHLQSLKEQKTGLQALQDQIKKDIAVRKRKQQAFQDGAVQLKAQVARLRQQSVNEQPSAKRQSQNQLEMVERDIKQCQGRVRSLEDRQRVLRARVEQGQARLAEKLNQKQAWQQVLLDLRQEAGVLDSNHQDSVDKSEKIKAVAVEKAEQETKEQMAQLQTARDQVRGLADEIRSVKETTKKQPGQVERSRHLYEAKLKQEQQLLMAVKQGLENFLLVYHTGEQKLSEIENQRGDLQTSQKQLQEKRQALQQEQDLLKEVFALQTQKQGLENDLNRTTQESLQKKADKGRLLAGQVKNFEDQLASLDQKNEGLKKAILDYQDNIKKLSDEKEELAALSQTKEKDKGSTIQEYQQEVENLKMKKTILETSLATIRKRFDGEMVSTQGFQNEQLQLAEYLKVLKQENGSLQERMLTLQVTTDKGGK